MYKEIQMKLSTMFKVYRYATAFTGFGLPGLLMEAAKSSIRNEIAFQLSSHAQIPEPETKPETIDFFTVVYRNHMEK